jgi:catechol 2,3-dioxygenase-like lactoylglutathione lyase family enzyme
MQPRVDFISLGVRDVAVARRFYVEGLGWPVHREYPGDMVFIQVNHGLMLSLWDAGQMQEEAALLRSGGAPHVTLSHNVGSPADVDRTMAEAEAAGAAVVVAPKIQPWGGYTGYFADPDGFRWEIAYNPAWNVGEDGQVTV